MTDTIVAAATPPGEGAVGLVRLSGPQALPVAKLLLRLSPGEEFPVKKPVLSRIWDGAGVLDRAVVLYYQAPHSYTGEDLVEIASHGSPYILSRVLSLAVEAGARPARPGEFTFRAFIHQKLDLTQAEAVCRLIRSRTSWSHRAAMRQLEGGLSGKIRELKEELLSILAHVEVQIDHQDEDSSLKDQMAEAEELQSRHERIERALRSLLDGFKTGRMLQDGVRIAIVGSPNSGKSSLLNALLRQERAIVSEVPGTTRDTLEEAADLRGLKAVVIDTAGLREKSLDPVEEMGMRRTRAALERSDLALLVMDRSKPFAGAERRVAEEIAALCRESLKPVIAVVNKCDLPPAWQDRPSHEGVFAGWVSVSARQGQGIGELIRSIHEAVGLDGSPGDHEWVSQERHFRCLEQSLAELRAAGASPAPEIRSLHYREALRCLGEIIGTVTAEDILGTIFSSFCIGK